MTELRYLHNTTVESLPLRGQSVVAFRSYCRGQKSQLSARNELHVSDRISNYGQDIIVVHIVIRVQILHAGRHLAHGPILQGSDRGCGIGGDRVQNRISSMNYS